MLAGVCGDSMKVPRRFGGPIVPNQQHADPIFIGVHRGSSVANVWIIREFRGPKRASICPFKRVKPLALRRANLYPLHLLHPCSFSLTFEPNSCQGRVSWCLGSLEKLINKDKEDKGDAGDRDSHRNAHGLCVNSEMDRGANSFSPQFPENPILCHR